MKKICTFMLMVLLLLSVAACGGKEPVKDDTAKDEEDVKVTIEKPAADEQEPAAEKPAISDVLEEQTEEDAVVTDVEGTLNELEQLEKDLSITTTDDVENDLLVELY